MNYSISAYSIYEQGQRDNQEDNIYPPFSEKPSDGPLFILCDGMGGHSSGEVASLTVCETMSHYIEEHICEDGIFGEKEFNAALSAAYDALDERDNGDERKMGTTLAFVKFHEEGCFTAHIGDSRIYHIRPSEGRVLHVTRDHSLVNRLVDLGEMTESEAKISSKKNIITRAMQPHQESRPKADCCNLTDLRQGDYIFVCSDGMLEEMEDRELVNILSLPYSDLQKVRILKEVTRNNRDNHSAHLIRIGTEKDGDRRASNAGLLLKVFILVIICAIVSFFICRHLV